MTQSETSDAIYIFPLDYSQYPYQPHISPSSSTPFLRSLFDLSSSSTAYTHIRACSNLPLYPSHIASQMAQEFRKCFVKASDMEEAQQQTFCDISTAAFAKYKTESEIAKYVKQEADTAYGPLWHCIVGKSFGSMVSHSPGDGFGGFIYLYVNNIAVLLFRTPHVSREEIE